MQKQTERNNAARKAGKRLPAFLLALLLAWGSCSGVFAQETETPVPPQEGETDGFEGSTGFPAAEGEDFSGFGDSSGMSLLTEESFPADDVPDDYLNAVSSSPGRVEKVRYTTSGEDSDTSAQVLYDAVVEQGYAKNDFRLYVATGTEDEAFEVSTNQMISLLEYADLFKPGENTSCSMMIGGTHTIQAVCTYMYHILPKLFFN